MKLTKEQKVKIKASKEIVCQLELAQEKVYNDLLKELNIKDKNYWLFDYLYNNTSIKTLDNL